MKRYSQPSRGRDGGRERFLKFNSQNALRILLKFTFESVHAYTRRSFFHFPYVSWISELLLKLGDIRVLIFQWILYITLVFLMFYVELNTVPHKIKSKIK